jgi:hypothetical protein
MKRHIIDLTKALEECRQIENIKLPEINEEGFFKGGEEWKKN